MKIKKVRKFYRNHEWVEFSKIIKDRDGNKCIKCFRNHTKCMCLFEIKFSLWLEGW